MAFCNSCGAAITQGTRFCSKCGAAITAAVVVRSEATRGGSSRRPADRPATRVRENYRPKTGR